MEITPIQRGVHEVAAIHASPAVEKPAEQRDIVQAVKALNQSEMLGQDNELLFQRDRQSQRMVIRVVNRKTGEGARSSRNFRRSTYCGWRSRFESAHEEIYSVGGAKERPPQPIRCWGRQHVERST
jgi:hypothetical protein